MRIVTPTDAAYEGVRHVYSATGSPARVFLPATTADVAEALAVARAADRQLAIRSGGHGISSIATNTGGDVIDLRALRDVEHLGGRRVRVGPGARWGTVAHALSGLGLAISSGDSGDVGVGGLATTGGIGLLGRAHGLTIDHLVQAEIVTADGETHVVSHQHEPDLFWAVRGAGANVGIVTSFEFEAAVVPAVVQVTAVYRPDDVAAFLVRWGSIVESAPRSVSAFLYLGGGAQAFAQATIVFDGQDVDAAGRAVGPFLALKGLVGQRGVVTPYANVPLTSGAAHSGQQRATTHSGLLTHLDGAAAEPIAAMLENGSADMVQLRAAGGAINDVAPTATAYAHRHQNMSVTAVSVGGGPAFDAAWAPVHERTDGMYLSFESDHHPDHVSEAFPEPTLGRLRAIKSVWDPDDVFNQNFDVAVVTK
ncbi:MULTISPECIES: FAD-binding oxidoreductase [Curtobacterium]|uniref:FAD-binding oxidoreductase n=1 Tax=Curtobacterium TaxID=2034 RepID=UPI000DA7FD62|nr:MULTISPECIES: FAD-binding protein [Curtobacterium]MCS5495416.1 FAD-binding protein [Curtobacterium flaccumfaciens pv. flaccumfaciens]PZF44619.1 FAD-binding oxidoreductase [Curtobacterium sp. MCLR17_053]PZF52700.1 FAD-binding oxidoreductase [Curtobacterium sp. MCLR17_051]